MSQYDAVLFDNDGILVHPPAEETKFAAARNAFGAVGVDAPETDHVDTVVNDATAETVRGVCEAYDIDVETFWDSRERCDERSQIEQFESGARRPYDDVEALADLSQACGVVSNNHHSTIEFILRYFDLEEVFDTYHGRERTLESLSLKKPDPHYVDRAVSELGAESALFVGDRELDVVAARRAGLDSVFVRRPHAADVELEATPTYEVDDLYEVVEIATGRSS